MNTKQTFAFWPRRRTSILVIEVEATLAALITTIHCRNIEFETARRLCEFSPHTFCPSDLLCFLTDSLCLGGQMRGMIVGLPISCLLWLLIFASARSLWAAPDVGKT